MTFSVIIPVYNDNGTLQRCLQSVMAQSEEDYEVIIVDDYTECHSVQAFFSSIRNVVPLPNSEYFTKIRPP